MMLESLYYFLHYPCNGAAFDAALLITLVWFLSHPCLEMLVDFVVFFCA
jgi:hypothetical protein